MGFTAATMHGLVGEEESRAAERIELEVVADEFGEGVEAYVHVECPVDRLRPFHLLSKPKKENGHVS